ncbi:MAG TPA: CBS domain-containing protein, partial [bacterium]
SVVDADAPLPEIQKIVIENHSGFIPVLSDGKLSGVITRSDLIDAIHSSFRYRSNEPDVIRKTPEEKGQELLSRIPESYSALLGIACELADSMNVGCYLVGGIVRDLVMGGKNSDIDLLIEGEGLLFAHALANTLDARVIENKRFQTGKVVLADGIHIDVATAREEIYPQPGALPEVEAAGIMDDLSRRDFTINTLAIQLNSRHWGRLIDHFGAVRDIEEKKIRVLHTFSFVEDPTRVMRALRFSARYGFEIDNDTRDLLIRALLEGRLDDVSHERIRDEILLCIREPEPWKIIRRLWDEGVFGVLDPGLTIPAGIRSDKDIVGEAYEWISRYLPEEELPDRDIVYIGFLLSETIPDDAHRFVNNYSFDGRVIRMADSFPEFATVREAISDANIKPSVLTENIEELTSALWANLVVGKPDDSPEKINVARYLAEYRNVQPEITGTDLISEGFAPGKSFGLALEKVRKAKLDGLIGSIEDEMRIVKETLHSV